MKRNEREICCVNVKSDLGSREKQNSTNYTHSLDKLAYKTPVSIWHSLKCNSMPFEGFFQFFFFLKLKTIRDRAEAFNSK